MPITGHRYSLRRQSTIGMLRAESPSFGTRGGRSYAAANNTSSNNNADAWSSHSSAKQRATTTRPRSLDDDSLSSEDGNGNGGGLCRRGVLRTVASPFKWLFSRLFLDVREDTDDFDTILRKIVISAGMPLVVFPIAFAFYLAAELSRVGVTTGGLVTLLVMFVFPLVWVPSFLYAYHNRRAPVVLLDVWLVVTTIGVLLLSLSLVEYPAPQLAFFLLVMALLCRTPRVWLHCLLCAAVYAVAMTNQAVAGLNAADIASVPDPYRGTVLERVAYQITCMVIGGIIASAIVMQVRENNRMVNAAAGASVVAREVANQLATYDIESAKDMLVGFSRRGDADPDLVHAFYAIVENLELYRPHLPQWIMQAHEEEREAMQRHVAEGRTPEAFDFAGRVVASPGHSGGGDSPDGAAKIRRGRRVQALTGRDLDLEVDIRVESVSNSPESDDLPHGHHGHHHHGHSHSGSGHGHFHSAQSFGAGHHPGAFRGGVPHGGGGGAGKEARTPMSSLLTAAAQKPFYGKATFAYLHAEMSLTPVEALGTTYDAVIEDVCDRLQEVASATHGVVHSIAGDAILMSWNAVQRTAVYETKSAKALAQLTQWTGNSQVAIVGAAMTDTVRCHHYGSRQKLFGARVPFRNVLWALSLFAKDRKALLVDDTAYRLAAGDVEMFPSDVVRVQDWRATAGIDYLTTPTVMSPKASVARNNSHLSHSHSQAPSPIAANAAHATAANGSGGDGTVGLHAAATPSRLSPSPASANILLPVPKVDSGNSPGATALGISHSTSIGPASDGTRLLHVYEVVREHGNGGAFDGSAVSGGGGNTGSGTQAPESSQGGGGHDEWMYVLQRRSRGRRGSSASDSDPIENAVGLAIQGRFHEALDLVTEYVRNVADKPSSGVNNDSAAAFAVANELGSTTHDGSPTHAATHAAAAPDASAEGENDQLSGGTPARRDSDPDACVPRPVLRLRQRLEQLVASSAAADEFPQHCVLGYALPATAGTGGRKDSSSLLRRSSSHHLVLQTPHLSIRQ